MQWLMNPGHDAGFRPRDPALGLGAAGAARALLEQAAGCVPTRLLDLREIATRAGIASLQAKDEGARLGLTSFKALGGAYALIRTVLDEAAVRLGRAVTAADLPRPASGNLAPPPPGTADAPGSAAVREAAATMVFACATDGNHGQSVAAGARLVGARAVIFVHEGVSQERRAAIARFGADIVEVPGSYDDAVAESIRQAEARGWRLLSDTSWDGYRHMPLRVMQGYAVMVHGLREQLAQPPTHVFLQAGVGGFAAAVAACLFDAWPDSPPRVVVVEPDRAACLLESARAGHRLQIPAGEPTAMAMLECYEPSQLAWELLSPMATAFIGVDEEAAYEAMKALAAAESPDEVVVAGESGCAGVAGLLRACALPQARHALGL